MKSDGACGRKRNLRIGKAFIQSGGRLPKCADGADNGAFSSPGKRQTCPNLGPQGPLADRPAPRQRQAPGQAICPARSGDSSNGRRGNAATVSSHSMEACSPPPGTTTGLEDDGQDSSVPANFPSSSESKVQPVTENQKLTGSCKFPRSVLTVGSSSTTYIDQSILDLSREPIQHTPKTASPFQPT